MKLTKYKVEENLIKINTTTLRSRCFCCEELKIGREMLFNKMEVREKTTNGAELDVEKVRGVIKTPYWISEKRCAT